LSKNLSSFFNLIKKQKEKILIMEIGLEFQERKEKGKEDSKDQK